MPSGWTSSYALGINDLGEMVGFGYSSTLGLNTQVFTGTTSGSAAVPLPAGWSEGEGVGINDAGQIAGFVFGGDGGSQAFIGTSSGITLIPLPSGWSGAILGNDGPTVQIGHPINDSGDVVGVASDGSAQGGWIWDPADGTQVLSSLVDPSWDITRAISINDEGQILAEATNTNGFEGYVLLDPVPEPGSIVLVITGFGLIAFAYRRSLSRSARSSPHVYR